ncbi:MAG TPA: helix-turn-helix transcriptional regulator [Puia sp.]
MNIDVRIPAKLLSPFIKRYLIIECPDESVNRVLPDTSLVMAFKFKGQVSHLVQDDKKGLSSFMISGLRKSGRLINYSKDTGNILVIFKEAAANLFFKEPLYELFEESGVLENFSGYRDVSFIGEQLAEATDNGQRVALIEDFLLSRLSRQQPDLLILAALEKIHLSKGSIKIKDLAASLYISQDAFEKRFRREVGASPKQFSYITRMKSIVQGGVKKQMLADIAFDAGYFDQPHFNKDFKLFTGQTPTDFIKSPVFW